ncbi:MAG: hypothetical protein A2293_05945 [Elusimicrobia bacterium RIFOXYB2_FULL_49_7]|nr:MAG: hypothetical protein A2293_05945 [Elusimicrobia bacterium RIFOXYB2_FULL_49_7]
MDDQISWPCHLISLFVTSENPNSCIQSPQEHLNWVNNSFHSYVDDNKGGICILAHPMGMPFHAAKEIAALQYLAGIEISHGGNSLKCEALWDSLLTICHDNGRPYLWGYGADDSHSIEQDKIGLSFVTARLLDFTEKDLKKALNEGAFYTSNGPSIAEITVTGKRISLVLSQESEVRWLKSGQWGFDASATVSVKRGNNHCVKCDKNVVKSDYLLNKSDSTIYPASARFIRALVIDKNGKVAQTMPFKIIRPDSIESYYPEKGQWYRGQTHNHCDVTGQKKRALRDYHLAYKKIGHTWSFATDYSYWLTPFQMHKEESIPVMTGVYPVHIREGEAAECTMIGRCFGNDDKIYIGGQLIKGSKWLYDTRLSLSLPDNLKQGCYDLTLVTPDGYKATLPDCIALQERTADNEGWTTFTTINSTLPSNKIVCVKVRNDNEIWVGTQYGAVRIKDNTWKTFTRDDYPQQIGDAILDIAFDHKNNVYLSHFRGLTIISPNDSIRLLRTEHGLLSREVNQVMITAKDDIWVSYSGRSNKISRSQDNGNHWEHFAPPNIEGCVLGIDLAEDRLGRILFSTPGKGVAVFDNNRWQVWNKANSGLADDFVRRLFVDKENRIFFATTHSGVSPQGGLSVLKDSHWQSYTQDKKQLASYRVWDVFVSHNGFVWCSTSNGVSCLNKAGQWKTYTMTNSGLASNRVLCATEDRAGVLWFATDKGLSRFQPHFTL